MKNVFRLSVIFISVFLLSSCASFTIIDFARTREFSGIITTNGIIGFGLAWYCWSEAKKKNRNEWLWLILGILFGFIPLFILVYLKDLPKVVEKPISSEEENTKNS